MATVKVAISIGDELLRRVDALVDKKIFPSRRKAIQEAVREKLERVNRSRPRRKENQHREVNILLSPPGGFFCPRFLKANAARCARAIPSA